MAIPFNLPSDQETENNYRSMDELLLQLYRVLRQILMHRERVTEAEVQEARQGPPRHTERRAVEAAGNGECGSPPPNATPRLPLPDVVPRLPLPDVVPVVPAASARRAASTTPPTSADQPAPRRTRRRRQRARDPPEKGARTPREPMRSKVRDNWTQVGDDLRVIADEFRSTLQPF